MDPIFSQKWNCCRMVGWDGDIYDLAGAHLAILNNQNVYGHPRTTPGHLHTLLLSRL